MMEGEVSSQVSPRYLKYRYLKYRGPCGASYRLQNTPQPFHARQEVGERGGWGIFQTRAPAYLREAQLLLVLTRIRFQHLQLVRKPLLLCTHVDQVPLQARCTSQHVAPLSHAQH